MKIRSKIDLDKEKLAIEQKKLELEQIKFSYLQETEEKKLQIASKSYRLDKFSKFAIPVALFGLSVATYLSSADRWQKEQDTKKSEYQIKQDERLMEKAKFQKEFIDQYHDSIVSNDMVKYQNTLKEAAVFFTGSDFNDIKEKIETIHYSVKVEVATAGVAPSIKQILPENNKTQPENDFTRYTNKINEYNKSLMNDANDAVTWYQLAYAQFRVADYGHAYKSITNSISLMNSQDYSEKHKFNAIINAAKIMCAQGKVDFSISYLNKSLQLYPSIKNTISKDGELMKTCNLSQ